MVSWSGYSEPRFPRVAKGPVLVEPKSTWAVQRKGEVRRPWGEGSHGFPDASHLHATLSVSEPYLLGTVFTQLI